LGADLSAKAPADGYTLGMAGNATMSIAPNMYPNLAYAPAKDFAPVARMASVPFVFSAPAESPIKSITQLIAAAKARPGELSYGSSGNGSTSHLVQALFAEMADVKVNHVPYKGSAASLNDLLGGRLDFSADTTAAVLTHLQSGRLRGIGASSLRRIPFLPDIPTLDEQGVKGYDAIAWAGLVAPAGTPQPVLARLNAEIVRITEQPEVRQRFATLAIVPLMDTREQFAAFLQSDLRQWTTAVKVSGARVE
jgi:tripartite-type tricarboxylate transporter receptor subunit TctC